MRKDRFTYLIILVAIGSIFLLLSFLPAKNTGTLQIIIEPYFNDKPLELSNTTYINASGDSLYIDRFKFYLSNLKFSTISGKDFSELNSYHLFDTEDSTTKNIIITNVPEGNYDEFNFSIGVDSIANVSGALGGDLDPIKGMYWAWNTGYIAAKIEGHSKVCKTLHNAFEFHVGGYLSPFNSLRKNKLKTGGLKIAASQTTTLIIKADVSEWFKTPATIDISKTSSIVLPCKESIIIADNYADMIKFKTISNP